MKKALITGITSQDGCPACAADLAEAILAIAKQVNERYDIAWGNYHFCGAGETTWHGLQRRYLNWQGNTIRF